MTTETLTLEYHPEDLPETAQEICEIVGFDATLRLIEDHGGTKLYIPAELPEDHFLIELLGEEKAKKLCWHYSTLQVSVPVANQMKATARYRAIVALRQQGYSKTKLARLFQLTERRIEQILARYRDSKVTVVTSPRHEQLSLLA
jgi:hypothetical protein